MPHATTTPVPRLQLIARALAPLFAVVGTFMLLAARVEAGESGTGRHYTVSARGQGPLRLYVEEQGHGDPVVLMHGLGASTYTWRKIVPVIARHHHVFNIDLKGFGRSDKPRDGRYGFLDQAALIKNLLIRRGLTGVTLVGHSLGGGVALATVLSANKTHPGLISRLVLIDAPAYPQPFAQTMTTLRDPVLGPLSVTLVPPEVGAAIALSGGGGYNKVTREDIRAYARPMYSVGARQALLATANQIVPPNLPALTKTYPTIEQPALLFWCRTDDVVPLSTGIRLSKALPHASLHISDGCLHLPMEEQPALLGQLIVKFLGDHHD